MGHESVVRSSRAVSGLTVLSEPLDELGKLLSNEYG